MPQPEVLGAFCASLQSWNDRFRKILGSVKDLKRDMTYADRINVWYQLSSLSLDFAYAAQAYGRIIISEVFLPNDKKTIKVWRSPGNLSIEQELT
jgi:hypothetical protein